MILFVLACGTPTPSSEVPTSEMVIEAWAIGGEVGATALEVEIREGTSANANPVILTGPDQLIATIDDSEEEIRLEWDGIRRYHADVLSNAAMQVRFTLRRQNYLTADQTWVNLPEPYVAAIPAGTIDGSLPFTVSWDPDTEDPMSAKLSVQCSEGGDSISVDAIGTSAGIVFPSGILDPERPVGYVGTCEGQVDLNRYGTGAVDPTFAGGSVMGNQVRSGEFVWAP